MQRIEVWGRVFSNPETLAMTLMANSWSHHEALMENVSQIENDIQSKSFEAMGV